MMAKEWTARTMVVAAAVAVALLLAAPVVSSSRSAGAAGADEARTLSEKILLIGVGPWHGTPPSPYAYPNRSVAAAACAATQDYPRLCAKAELAGYSDCAVGWCADWCGYWMAYNQTGCGHAGFNAASASVPMPSTIMAGAYCCLPLPSNTTHVERVSPTRFATAAGPTSKPAIVVFSAPGASPDAPVTCRVSSVNSGGYNLDWTSARRAKPWKNMTGTGTPGGFKLYPRAVRVNATAVACDMPPLSVEGPGALSISVDGNKTFSLPVPVMFYEAVSANTARRPYFSEVGGTLLLQSDPALDGAIMDVTVLLTAVSKTWTFQDIPAIGANASLLPLPFAGLPQTLNNDLVVTVTVHTGDSNTDALPWTPAEAGGVATTITLYTRLIRAAPPPSSSNAIPVQIDRETVGRLLVGGQPFAGVGWYVSLNAPTCVSGATPRNKCDVGIPTLQNMSEHLSLLGSQGVTMVMIYGLQEYNASAQTWLLDQAITAGIKLLLDFPAPPGYKSATQPCGEWQNDTAYRERVAAVTAVALHHPATLGYFICDDCVTPGVTWADNYRCIARQAQLYNFAKEFDPWHLWAGAVTGNFGWWFSDNGPGFLPPTPGVLSQQTLQLGSQPITQLSVDLFLQENYYPSLDAHKNRADSASDWDADGSYTQGLKLLPVANSAGIWFPSKGDAGRVYSSIDAFVSVMWLGVVEGGMSHQLAFIYGEFEEAHGGHKEFTSMVGEWGRQLAPLLPAIHRSVATDEPPHPAVVVGHDPDSWRARAWRIGKAGNLTIHVVVVNLDDRAGTFEINIDATELQHGSWAASQQQQKQKQHQQQHQHNGLVVPLRGHTLSDEVGASTTAVYSIRAVV